MKFFLLLLVALPLSADVTLAGFTELLEWTLGLSFTTAERTELAGILLDDRTMTSLSQAQSIFEGMTTEKRVQAQPTVQAGILKNLRATSKDRSSQFLLHAFERRQADSAGESSGGRLPTALLGDWTSAHASTTGFVNRATGSSGAPSGNMETYHFFPDGSFRGEVAIQSTLYQCTVTAVILEFGRVFVTGGNLIFERRGGTVTTGSTCNRGRNETKPLELRNIKYLWRMAGTTGIPQLCLSAPGKSETCFLRHDR